MGQIRSGSEVPRTLLPPRRRREGASRFRGRRTASGARGRFREIAVESDQVYLQPLARRMLSAKASSRRLRAP
ncbi:hypothetical protein GQ55_2G121500 [Panicum hallii var. hallii]|uniref:Uncharacterized protein n=1 Tax=Panicum hallii var. hallii TaxID=1504633 RepID=A0A2T7EP25_9POAL|nr:hypothetical protein GQ55_2G121500 [Panicum hallii var. hallii]